MKPKEKAEELVGKFEGGLEFAVVLYNSEILIGAKECALICVEKMIEECEGHPKGIKYWQDVKLEINKL